MKICPATGYMCHMCSEFTCQTLSTRRRMYSSRTTRFVFFGGLVMLTVALILAVFS